MEREPKILEKSPEKETKKEREREHKFLKDYYKTIGERFEIPPELEKILKFLESHPAEKIDTRELQAIKAEVKSETTERKTKKGGLMEKLARLKRTIGFIAGLSILSGGGLILGQAKESQKIESVAEEKEKFEEKKLAEDEILPGLSYEKISADDDVFEVEGEKIARGEIRQKLDELIRQGMEKYTSPDIAATCASAEQCYLYYNDQINFNEQALSLATGKTQKELKFYHRVIKKGFAETPAMIMPAGMIKGAVFPARNLLPIKVIEGMNQEDQKEFYQDMYEKHLGFLENITHRFGLLELASEEDKTEIIKILGQTIETETEVQAMRKLIDWKYRHYDKPGVAEGLEKGRFNQPSTLEQFEKLREKQSNNLKKTASFLEEKSPQNKKPAPKFYERLNKAYENRQNQFLKNASSR